MPADRAREAAALAAGDARARWLQGARVQAAGRRARAGVGVGAVRRRPVRPLRRPAATRTGGSTRVEVVNEPNLQLWPQRSPAADASRPFGVDGSELTIHRAVAEMMMTVDGLARDAGGLLCLGPSTADADGA